MGWKKITVVEILFYFVVCLAYGLLSSMHTKERDFYIGHS